MIAHLELEKSGNCKVLRENGKSQEDDNQFLQAREGKHIE